MSPSTPVDLYDLDLTADAMTHCVDQCYRYAHEVKAAVEEIKNLRAENERLRAALDESPYGGES